MIWFLFFIVNQQLPTSNWLAVHHVLLAVSDEVLLKIKNVRVKVKYIKKALNRAR